MSGLFRGLHYRTVLYHPLNVIEYLIVCDNKTYFVGPIDLYKTTYKISPQLVDNMTPLMRSRKYVFQSHNFEIDFEEESLTIKYVFTFKSSLDYEPIIISIIQQIVNLRK